MAHSLCNNSVFFFAPTGVTWLTSPALAAQDWLWHGFSTRTAGVTFAYATEGGPSELNLGFTAADTRENVMENRALFVEAVTGSRETPLATARQVHANQSVIAALPLQTVPEEADGLLSNTPRILLGIQTADCIPVLVADPVHHAVAAFHAGWRGTVERIVERGIAGMQAEFGSQPSDLVAAIGPGIGPCCYAVGEELRSVFVANFSYGSELFSTAPAVTSGPGANENPALYLDLIEANRRQLIVAGLEEASISVTGGCTACQPHLFYSHRASGGHAGRLMSVIGVR